MATTADPLRWPDVAAVPHAPIRAAIAARLFRRFAVPPPRVHRPADLHHRLGARGLIGLGESYQAGDWDADDLAALLTEAARRMQRSPLRRIAQLRHQPWVRPLFGARMPAADENTLDGARRNIGRHYDLSNEHYLAYCEAGFVTGELDVGQLILTRAPAGTRQESPRRNAPV